MPNQTQIPQDTHQHRDSSSMAMSTVGKTLSAAKSAIGESADVGSRVVGQALAKVGGVVKQSKNRSLNDIFKAIVGAGFGLGFVKEILGIPKIISNPELREKQSPMLIKGAKWLFGGSMALAIFKGVMGGAGLSMPVFLFGLTAFIFTHALSSTYENPNSIFGKICSAFGLREKLVDAMNSMKIGNFMS